MFASGAGSGFESVLDRSEDGVGPSQLPVQCKAFYRPLAELIGCILDIIKGSAWCFWDSQHAFECERRCAKPWIFTYYYYCALPRRPPPPLLVLPCWAGALVKILKPHTGLEPFDICQRLRCFAIYTRGLSGLI
jgi:hypothetical protein